MPTIFDSVVTKENDHTNLLRNILERHPKAAAVALSYLLGSKISEVEAATLTFSTQHSFLGPNGREIPDMLVEGPGFRCLIEAKVDPTLELTDGQKAGYRGCFPESGNCHLAFLVPGEWKHLSSVEKVRSALPKHIAVRAAYWRGLVNELVIVSASLNDAILDEAINFWKWRFQLERMTPDERNSLNLWSEEKYSAMRKLEKTLTQAKGLFDARGYETELETSDTYSYGFYIKRNRQYLLWVGIWTKAPAPLSFGFHSTKSNWLRPKEIPFTSHTSNSHHLWPIGPETWDEPERLYETVELFLQSHPVD
jgi:hypothetical protein